MRSFWRRSLDDVLFKRIKVMRVRFVIKKIDVGNYLEGNKILIEQYSTYKTKDEEASVEAHKSYEKAKAHMIDVFMSGIVEPKLSRKHGEPGTTFVEYLFTEPRLAIGLYQAIIEYTFGKKKVPRNLQRLAYSRSMR